jgi:hypothetical protein
VTNWTALDVAIGLVVTYFVLSLLCSTVNEAIATALGWRAKYLERWLRNLLVDPAKSAQDVDAAIGAFYDHPLIRPLIEQPRALSTTKTRKRKPSYIATDVFSSVVLTFERAPATLDEVVAGLPSPQLRDIVTRLRQETDDDLAKLKERIERWYDDSMERVSGWYKRRVQIVLAVLGLVFAIVLNADTIGMVGALWSDKTVRAAVVAEADRVTQTAKPTADLKAVAQQVKQIKSLDVPLGWKLEKGDPRDLPHTTRLWLSKVIGIILTAIALTLGAPFWFDLLSKLMRLRGGGAPPPPRDGTRTGEGEQRREGVRTTPA